MAKIFINDLANELSERFGCTKQDATQFINHFVATIQQGVAADQMVKIKGLGTFKTVEVEARESVNVNTGERVTIDSHTKLTFVADSVIKELVNRPFSQFETVVLNEGVTFDDMPIEELEEPVTDEEMFDEDAIYDVPEENAIPAEEAPVAEPIAEGNSLAEKAQAPVIEKEKDSLEENAVTEDSAPVTDDHATPAIEEEKPMEEDKSPNVEDSSEEPQIAEEGPDIDDEEENDEQHHYWWLWLILAVAACVISFAAGYLFGSKTTLFESVEENVPTAIAPRDSIVPVAPLDTVHNDTVKQETISKPVVQKPETPVTNTSIDEEWKKYEEMDVRIRTGAYRIVGTDQVIKARAGDTISRIARRTLGEGMECYIEVYNGISAKTPLQAGQEVKIPKLQWKKKKK